MKTYEGFIFESQGPTFLRDRGQRLAVSTSDKGFAITLKGQSIFTDKLTNQAVHKMINSGSGKWEGVANGKKFAMKISAGIGYFTVGDDIAQITSKQMKEFADLMGLD